MRSDLHDCLQSTSDPHKGAKVIEDLREIAENSGISWDSCAPGFVNKLIELLVLSPPMLDILRRNPDRLSWLNGRVEQLAGSAPDYETEWVRWTGSSGGSLSFEERICAFKRHEYLYIAFSDLAGLVPLEVTTRQISDLADYVLRRTLMYCTDAMREAEPADRPTVRPESDFAVFAMGKLGGRELNYCSDIDLLFFRSTSSRESEALFYKRLGELYARTLSHVGREGSLYKVDLRLRPYGETGPLVPTINSLTSYYESWGEPWESQALTKARFVAGSEELGRRFADFIERHVYSSPMADTSLEELKRVKYRAESNHRKHEAKIDVKHGKGGIRDIEFYVQYHQLIAGASHPEVRNGNTLAAIGALERRRVLLAGESSALSLAYRLLRIVEHRLQLKSLSPNTLVPDAPAERETLARGLGFSAAPGAQDELLHCLRLHSRRVRDIFERIYHAPGQLRVRDREEAMSHLLTERTPREKARTILHAYGFHDLDKAWQNLRFMALGPQGRLLPTAERRLFLQFAPDLLDVIKDSHDPDLALHHLESLAGSSGNRISFLRALCTNPVHLLRLANLLSLSKHAHQVLCRHPEYFDSLARGWFLHESRDSRQMYRELKGRFGLSPTGVPREDIIRRYQQRETVRIAYRDLSALGDPLEISGEISALAEACLQVAYDLARPSTDVFTPADACPIRVIGLGKMGSRQMHYSSDLDLLFVYEQPQDRLGAADRAQLQTEQDARARRILDLLAQMTREGIAYKIDLRLRPEGTAGTLTRSFESLLDYCGGAMQPWERFALVRSRELFGSNPQGGRWGELLQEAVYDYPWQPEALDAIRALKRRIESEKNRESPSHVDFKYGRGGILDLEFMVQFLQIQHAAGDARVRTPELGTAIEGLSGIGVLTNEECRNLLEIHRFQRLVENHYQVVDQWPAREISRESPRLIPLARSAGYREGDPEAVRRALLSQWDDFAGYVRRAVDKYFYA